MPRGRVAGATAALIDAVRGHGVTVSAYQIERWRTVGLLPHVSRRGLGRGKGTTSQLPDEAVIARAVALARQARQGKPQFGAHVLERLALGVPVAEAAVRKALTAQLNGIAQMIAADLPDDDHGWQARQDLVPALARGVTHVGWQDLIDAVDGQAHQPEPTVSQRRAAAAGLVHAVAGSIETTSEDLAELFAVGARLDVKEQEELRSALVDAQLNGEDDWPLLVEAMSLRNLRNALADADMSDLQRAAEVTYAVSGIQGLVTLFGVLDIAGHTIELPDRLLRFDEAMVRRLQADPMWSMASALIPSLKWKTRIQGLALHTLILVMVPAVLQQWEAYRDRLLKLIDYPQDQEPDELHASQLEQQQA